MSGFWPATDQADGRLAEVASGPATGFAENFEAQNREMQLINRSVSKHSLLSEAYAERIDEIEKATGQRLPNPVGQAEQEMLQLGRRPLVLDAVAVANDTFLNKYMDDFEKAVEPWRAKHPQLATKQKMLQQLGDMVRSVEEETADISDRATFTGKVGGFIGSMAGAMQDPINLVTLPLGAGAANGIIRTAVTEAIVNAGSETLIQTKVQPFRGELGLEYGFEQGAENVAFAAGGAAVVGGAVKAGGKLAESGSIGRSVRKTIDLGGLVGDKLLKLFDSAVSQPTRAQREARGLYEHISEINESSPLDREVVGAEAEHNQRLTEAMRAARDGRAADMPDMPAAPVSRAALDPAPKLQGIIETFDPAGIQSDARTFQFKEGGDSSGVTERLDGVAQWDETKAGMVIVFEDNFGQRFIADGHQRLGLAKRLQAKDPTQKITLYGPLLREADGYTPEAVRVIAAMKNIAEGTGSAIDAAKVLRTDPARLKELPPRSQLVRQAADMVNLSDEAFGFVVNEIVPANYAAVVGRLVKDEKLQLPIMNVLAKVEPENAVQAEAIIRQAMEVGTRTETQINLFGEEQVTSSLYLERAKVLDKALKKLRIDRKVFQVLVDNARQLEDAGNVLKTDANAATAETAARASQMIQTLANRKGGLSDALSAAARRAADEGRYVNATADFVEAVRSAIERGDFSGLADGGHGRAYEAAGEDAPRASAAADLQPDEKHLKKFAEPAGAGQLEQTRALEADVRGAIAASIEQEASRLAGPDLYRMPEADRADLLKFAKKKSFDALDDLPRSEKTAIIQKWLESRKPELQEIPVGARIDEQGKVITETRTVKDLLDEIDQDQKDLDAISSCGVP